MRIKSILRAVLLAVVICFTPITQTIAAGESYIGVSPMYEIAQNAWCTLRLSGSNATCQSFATSDGAVKIVAVQTLQKQGFLWIWGTYDKTVWTETVNAGAIAMSNTKTGLSSGKYRLKTVFTFTDKNGNTETVTVYSDAVSV